MQNLHFRALILMLTGAGIFFSGCTDKTVSPTGTGAPGNIHGKVMLYDTLSDPFTPTGAARINDASGVQVTVEGTSYSTVTDSLGQWQLSNVPSGTYTSIVFSKAGFAKQKATNLGSNVGFSIVNNGTETINMNLYRISLISCDIVLRPFEDYMEYGEHDTLTVLNGNPSHRYIRDSILIPNGAVTLSSRILDQFPGNFYPCYSIVYFGANSQIDALDGSTFLYSAQPQSVYTSFTGTADILVLRSALIDAGFRPGQTIYCVAYCSGRFIYSSEYEDMATGMAIYSGLSPNHSEVKSFVLP
jgi:hypothetical protein